MNEFVLVAEMIGTIAFAISGSVVGIKRNTDLFGVIALGVVTATGGGCIRDVILGNTPPNAFVNPIYVITAAATSFVVFIVFWNLSKKGKEPNHYTNILFLMDTIGLGIFTSVGVMTVINYIGSDNGYLCVFSGLVTGVGGGLLRDVIVEQLPDIFIKHIYAVASICGAVACLLSYRMGYNSLCIYIGMFVVVVVRILARHYLWNLPKIDLNKKF